MARSKNPGRILRHEDGRIGIWFNSDKPVNGKIPVSFAKVVKKILVDPKLLKQIGFSD